MEDHDFELTDWEQEAERLNLIHHRGQTLLKELLTLRKLDNPLLLDEFFSALTPSDMSALNQCILRYEQIKNHLAELSPEAKPSTLAEIEETIPKEFHSLIGAGTASSRHNPIKNQQPETTALTATRDDEDLDIEAAFKKWAEEHKPPAMAKSSFEEFSRMIEFFITCLKHIAQSDQVFISDISKAWIGSYKEIVKTVPKGIKIKDKTIEELLAASGAKKSATTIKGIFVNVGHFIRWLSCEGYPVQANIHEVLTHHRKISSREKKRRKPLDNQDLVAIFNSKQYTKGLWKRSSEYWAPLIALFTGACRNEILQLEVADVYQLSGCEVIDINDRNGKQLKQHSNDMDNENSTGRPRIIPIHSELIRLGFLEFVAHQKQKGLTQLFPDEQRNSRGHYGAYGNRFSAFRKEVGVIPRDDTELRDFHSFRHLVRTRLSDHKTRAEGIVDDIMGHSSRSRSSMGQTYDHSDRVDLKQESIEFLKYDCINFGLITRWNQCAFAKLKNGIRRNK